MLVLNNRDLNLGQELRVRKTRSDEEPWVTGSIGLLGTKPSWDMMMGADTLLTRHTVSAPQALFNEIRTSPALQKKRLGPPLTDDSVKALTRPSVDLPDGTP